MDFDGWLLILKGFMKNESLIERAQYAIEHPDVLHTPVAYREIIAQLLDQNVCVLQALIEIRDRLRGHPEYQDLTIEEQIEVGGQTAELAYLVSVADDAIDKASTLVDARRLDAVADQRDELLAALELVVKCCDEPRSRDNSEYDGITALEAARTAIAKVKGGAT